MWSPPTLPLAGQSGLWQNALVGSMGSSFQVAIGLATCQDVPGTPFRLPPRPFSRFPGVLPDVGDNKHSESLAGLLQTVTNAEEVLGVIRRLYVGCVNVANANILALEATGATP